MTSVRREVVSAQAANQGDVASPRRALRLLAAAGLLALGAAAAPARAAVEPDPPCTTRTLVLSAYPGEADAVLSHMTLDAEPARVIDGHHFYVGTMAGKPVISTMTGIGLTNATNATEKALSGFTCEATGMKVGAVLFSGVAGGAERTRIGDVAVPARWTVDDGATYRQVDPDMLAAAAGMEGTSVPLSSVNTAGDPACLCTDPNLVPLIDLERDPAIFVGGDGASSDALQGKASPCIPGGGDVFGCEPCTAPDRSEPDPTATGQGAVDWFMANFEGGYPEASSKVYDAVDQETAAAQIVADAHGVPFLAFRGMSDGPGDPLNLPGFPFQFFFYRQLAADNAAIAVNAYLQTWAGPADATTAPEPAPASVLAAKASAPTTASTSTRSFSPLQRRDAALPASASPATATPPAPSATQTAAPISAQRTADDENLPWVVTALAVMLICLAGAGTVGVARR